MVSPPHEARSPSDASPHRVALGRARPTRKSSCPLEREYINTQKAQSSSVVGSVRSSERVHPQLVSSLRSMCLDALSLSRGHALETIGSSDGWTAEKFVTPTHERGSRRHRQRRRRRAGFQISSNSVGTTFRRLRVIIDHLIGRGSKAEQTLLE